MSVRISGSASRQRLQVDQFSFVMAGRSRPKDGVASARLCPGHPRLSCGGTGKTWMPGTSPGMTRWIASTRLDRQRLIRRPFAHRAVIEGEVVVAEPVELQQIHRRRDAAAAIGDHALVPGDAGACEFLFGVPEREKGF